MNDLEIFGSIGWEVTPAGVSAKLKEAGPGALTVRINSPGGVVVDGIAIASMLRRHGNATAIVEGIAASAASVIAIGARRVVMAQGAYLMIHNPWSTAIGEAADLRKEASVLDSIAGELAKLYADASGGKLTAEQALAMMEEETWLTAEQAVEVGLAHAIEGKSAVRASIDRSRHNYRNIPGGYTVSDTTTDPAPKAGLIDTIMARLGGNADAIAAKDAEISVIRAELTTASAALVDAVAKLADAQAALAAKDEQIEAIKAEHIEAIAAARAEAAQNAVAEVLAGSAPAPLSHEEPEPSEGALERYNRLHAEGKKAEAFAHYERHQTEIDSARRQAGKE